MNYRTALRAREAMGKVKSRAVVFAFALLVTAWGIGFPLPNVNARPGRPVIRASTSTSALRNQLMAITPPGTRATTVSTFVASELRVHGESDQSVIDQNSKLRRGPALIPKPNAEVRGWHYAPVGAKHITAIFRSPSLSLMLVVPVATKNAVEVSYAFDTEDRLLDIGVAKWVEGLP
jgi:hypothetical protein